MGSKPISWLGQVLSPIKDRVDNNKQEVTIIGKKYSEGVENNNLKETERNLTYAECVVKGDGKRDQLFK